MKNASTDEEAQKLFSDSNLETILDLAGTLQVFETIEDVLNVVDKTAHWFVLERVQASSERFKVGHTIHGVFYAMLVLVCTTSSLEMYFVIQVVLLVLTHSTLFLFCEVKRVPINMQ